jgi:hypothetical protein
MMKKIGQGFLRSGGVCLVLAGVLLVVVAAGLTPFLPAENTRQADIFLWRQSASAAVAALLLFGALGIYLRQADHPGIFPGIAFATASLGSALLLAQEWNEIFFARDLAIRLPAALETLEAEEFSRWDIGALLAVSGFTLGWLALAASTLITRRFPRWAGWSVIGGFFAIPLSQPLLPGPFGPIPGSLILGAGFAGLGYDLLKRAPTPCE